MAHEVKHAYTFERPDLAWSTNQDRNLNPYTRADRIATWKTAAQLGWTSYRNRGRYPKHLPPAIVHVSIPFTQRRRRDPHNYCGTVVKAVIDGLVLAGCWPDDTPEWVGHIEPTISVGGEQVVVVSLFDKQAAHFACEHGTLGPCARDECEGSWSIDL